MKRYQLFLLFFRTELAGWTARMALPNFYVLNLFSISFSIGHIKVHRIFSLFIINLFILVIMDLLLKIQPYK